MKRRLTVPLLAIGVTLVSCAESPAQAETADERASATDAMSPTPSADPSVTLAPASPSPSAEPPASPLLPSAAPEPVTLIAAGDIAACDEEGDSATAALVETLGGTVATLGDNVYPAGSPETYGQCYHPVWGRFLERTRPSIGNHDAQADGGAAYFAYFGESAGRPGEGWYSYELGEWHIIVLNTNCGLVGCGPGSAQYAWLEDDLARTDAGCTLAYWHHPLFSSISRGGFPEVAPLWQALDEADAELVLVGHDHLYERFAPQSADGTPDPRGLRQFIVGTGGKQLYPRTGAAANSEFAMDDSFGVLQLTLRPGAYDWSFLMTDGTVADHGSGACH